MLTDEETGTAGSNASVANDLGWTKGAYGCPMCDGKRWMVGKERII